MKPANAITFHNIIFNVHLQNFASKVLSAHNFNVNVALFAAQKNM